MTCARAWHLCVWVCVCVNGSELQYLICVYAQLYDNILYVWLWMLISLLHSYIRCGQRRRDPSQGGRRAERKKYSTCKTYIFPSMAMYHFHCKYTWAWDHIVLVLKRFATIEIKWILNGCIGASPAATTTGGGGCCSLMYGYLYRSVQCTFHFHNIIEMQERYVQQYCHFRRIINLEYLLLSSLSTISGALQMLHSEATW